MNMEQHLELLAEDIQFPQSPDFATSLTAHLTPRPVRVDWRHRVLLVAAVIVIVIAATLAIPDSRTAIANWLGLGGIRIEFVDELLDRDDRVAIDSSLIVGEEIDIEDVSLWPGNTVMTLPNAKVERAYIRTDNSAKTVSLFYLPGDDLPEIGETGVGALLMQFDSPKSFTLMIKQSGFPEDGTFTQVGEDEGYWVPSGNLIAIPYDPQDAFGLESVSRETGNVLLWQADGITYRLETNLNRVQAVALAKSLVPLLQD
jgi:hypothetical protein